MNNFTVRIVQRRDLRTKKGSSGLTFPVLCNQQKATATLATSWLDSAISPELCQTLRLRVHNYRNGNYIEPIAQQVLIPVGLVEVMVSIGETHVVGEMMVLNMGAEMLLGLDFLRAFKFDVTISSYQVDIDSVRTPDESDTESNISEPTDSLQERTPGTLRQISQHKILMDPPEAGVNKWSQRPKELENLGPLGINCNRQPFAPANSPVSSDSD